jgi:hypothetical protein
MLAERAGFVASAIFLDLAPRVLRYPAKVPTSPPSYSMQFLQHRNTLQGAVLFGYMHQNQESVQLSMVAEVYRWPQSTHFCALARCLIRLTFLTLSITRSLHAVVRPEPQWLLRKGVTGGALSLLSRRQADRSPSNHELAPPQMMEGLKSLPARIVPRLDYSKDKKIVFGREAGIQDPALEVDRTLCD